jgi:two-component system, cell cycle sensor histidine kinase and response regulator CckA
MKDTPYTILIVDDNPRDRAFLVEALQDEGYLTLEAENGKQALEIFQRNSDLIDLVLTDIVMPVMDGVELLCQLRQFAPHTKVLLLSGQPERTGQKINGEKVEVTPKSSDFASLLKRVNDALHQKPSFRNRVKKLLIGR